MQNPTFCVYFKRSQTSPLDFKKTADNTHPWGFTIAVYTPKVEGKDLIVLTIDEKPGKIFAFIQSALELVEVDEQFKFILEKIKLYTLNQTISVKGTEYCWNFSDYSLRYFTHSSTTNQKKYSFLEFSTPFIAIDKKRLDQETQKCHKFAQEILNGDSSISSMSFELNANDITRYKNYIKLFYPQFNLKLFADTK